MVEVGFRILSLSLENQMLSAFEPFKAAYFEVNGEVSKIDLAELKEELGDEVDFVYNRRTWCHHTQHLKRI